MDVFDFRNRLIDEYGAYINSFINVQDPRIRQYIQDSLQAGHLWPDPLIQLNPSFEPGEKELKAYGEFRTRRLVLEKWDGMPSTDAARSR